MFLGLEAQDALSVWVWGARLWPLVLVGGFFVLFRASLQNHLAFLVLGVVLCFGVQLIVGQVSLGLPVNVSENTGASIQLLEILLQNLFRTTLVSALIAVGPLWWLYRLLRRKHSNV